MPQSEIWKSPSSAARERIGAVEFKRLSLAFEPGVFSSKTRGPVGHALRAAENGPPFFVIPSEARNPSFFSFGQIQERFLASLGMTKKSLFSPSVQPARF